MAIRPKLVHKSVLIITYYWPPAGGPGVQRWLKFVTYLPHFHIKPVVFVPKHATYPITDKSLKAELPNNTEIIEFPIKEPYKIARLVSRKKTRSISKGLITERKNQSLLEKLLLFIRGNFFIPDARVGWVAPATQFLKTYITKHNIDTIITTGPPHSLHLIGLGLKTELSLRWIADFRDPWTTIGYHKQLKLTQASKQKHLRFEASVLNSADELIVTSKVTKHEFQQKTTRPITVITNGYDDETKTDFKLDSNFSIAHIGSFLSKRNPELLWRVLSEIIKEDQRFSSDFKLHLVGFVSDAVLQSLAKYNLTDYVDNVGYVSHKQSIEFQKKSQVLLLVEIDSHDTKAIIPGKLFEYMVSRRPILAIGPDGSDVETIIAKTKTGFYFSHKDYKGIKSAIITLYETFKQGHLVTNPQGLAQYHRKALTHKLAEVIKGSAK